jgi:hypothetical protein
MKTNITISIDTDVAEALKSEKDKSSLVNSYLRSYFQLGTTNQREIELKKALLDEQIKKDMESAF